MAPSDPPTPAMTGTSVRRQGWRYTAGQRGFDHLLRQVRERERHADIVHRKRQRLGDLEVPDGVGVRPDHGDRAAQRQCQVVLDGKPPARASRLPFPMDHALIDRLSGPRDDLEEEVVAGDLVEHEAAVLVEAGGGEGRAFEIAPPQLARRRPRRSRRCPSAV